MDPATATLGIAASVVPLVVVNFIIPGIVGTTFLVIYRHEQKRKRRNRYLRELAVQQMQTQQVGQVQASNPSGVVLPQAKPQPTGLHQ